ncbi:fibronectin type III domain-containing protein [Candidatus Poriferisodalis sp.]|uniref:fibronectin type III domain-containing protein n=1 Tax=Candidatus Poriferisodalis sp. TaxID=3101277 RepID=UPI003B02D3BE
MLAVVVAHDAPPVQAQTLGMPATAEMQRSCLGFYLWWVESPGATGYEIEISSKSGGTWGAWSSSGVSHSGITQPAIVTGLTHGTEYRWRIRATKGTIKSDWTLPKDQDYDIRTARRCAAGRPNPPLLHSAVAGPEQVTLTWEAGALVSGAAVVGFKVLYRWEDEHGSFITRSASLVGADATTAVVPGLTAGVTYDVWVRAFSSGGQEASSRALEAVPQMGTTSVTSGRCNLPGYTPPGPSTITTFTPTHNSVTLYWNSPVYGTTSSGRKDHITDFLVWVKTADNSHSEMRFVTAKWYEPATYSHTIPGLSPTTDYWVGLNARTITACYSGWSSVAVTTTASLNSGGFRIGVLQRPTQEEQPEQPENESAADSQPTPETASGSAPETEAESAPKTESESPQASESDAESAPDSQPAPETEPESAPESDDVVDRYDANGDGAIDSTEYRAALKDYAAGTINYDDLLKVVKAYLRS